MQGSFSKKRTSEQKITERKYNKMIKSVLPHSFHVMELELNGKKIIADMEKLLVISNTDSEYEVINAMNKVCSLYAYFGRVKVDLQQQFEDKEEEFEKFMAKKRMKFLDQETSEKGRERRVMIKYPTTYKNFKNEIRKIKLMYKYSEIIHKSFDKNIEVIRSIGSMLKRNREE